jgi:hypothetical protein
MRQQHMAKNKKKGRGSNDDVIVISKDDWKGKGDFPVAPGGKYRAKFNGKKSTIKPNAAGNGNVLNLMTTLTALHNGKKIKLKKGKGKGPINVFDNIAPHVGWKIAQVLRAMGVKKAPKKMTLKELLDLIKKYDKEIRVVVGIDRYKGKDKNNITMYLPLSASKDEDDDDTEDDDDDDEDSDDDDDEDSDDDDSDDDSDDDDDDDDSDDDDEDDEDDDDDEDEDDEEDEDDDDDDDDDDEDRPSKKKKSSKKSKKRK